MSRKAPWRRWCLDWDSSSKLRKAWDGVVLPQGHHQMWFSLGSSGLVYYIRNSLCSKLEVKAFGIRKSRLTSRPSLRPSVWMSSPRVWLLSVVGEKTRRRKQHSSWLNEQGEEMQFSMRGVGWSQVKKDEAGGGAGIKGPKLFPLKFILYKDSWFTMLCYFQIYIKVIQLYVYLHSFSYIFPLWFIQFSSVAQSCPTLCDPMDCSLPGSSVHGIFQARGLEWVAISFSRGSSLPRDRIQVFSIADRRFTVWATREAPYGLLQDVKYSSLCYTAGPCCLSILYIIVRPCWPQTPNPRLPTALSFPCLGNRKSLLYACEFFSVYKFIFVFLCLTYFTTMIVSRYIHDAANVIISFFFGGRVVFPYARALYLPYPFICWRACKLFPWLGFYK